MSDPFFDDDLSDLDFAAPPTPRTYVDLWAPKDVTPKALRGRGVKIERRLVGYGANPHSPTKALTARYQWRMFVRYRPLFGTGTGWRCLEVCKKLRKAKELAELHADPND